MRNWLVVSKLALGIWWILTRVLKSLKNVHFNGFLLTKVCNFCARKVQRSYDWWHWNLMQNLKENWLALSHFHRLKNSNFILKSKTAELNQNKNSKQPNRPDSEWKLHFTLEINENTIKETFYTSSTESLFVRYKKTSKKAVNGFLQSLVHIFLGHDGCFWQINLTILWMHIIKNCQVKHSQCDSIIFPKAFSFKSSK